jgi:hypothetical protein
VTTLKAVCEELCVTKLCERVLRKVACEELRVTKLCVKKAVCERVVFERVVGDAEEADGRTQAGVHNRKPRTLHNDGGEKNDRINGANYTLILPASVSSTLIFIIFISVLFYI